MAAVDCIGVVGVLAHPKLKWKFVAVIPPVRSGADGEILAVRESNYLTGAKLDTTLKSCMEMCLWCGGDARLRE